MIINYDRLEHIGQFEAPAKLKGTKKRPFYVNINRWHDTNRFTLANAKKEFKARISVLKTMPRADYPIFISYAFYPPQNRKYDINNVISLADKFFCDWLQDAKLIPDDDIRYIPHTPFGYHASVDKNNPHFVIDVFKIIV